MPNFSNILAPYFTAAAKSRIKRYVVGANLYFGGSLKIPGTSLVFTAPKPTGNRIKLYNSYKEAKAERTLSGKDEFLNTANLPGIKNITFPDSVVREIMEYNGNPYEYTSKWKFSVEIMVNSMRKIITYAPSQMGMELIYSTDVATFEKLKAASETEKSLELFAHQAQINCFALAALIRNQSKMSPAQLTKLNAAIVDHNYVVKDMINNLPLEARLSIAQLQSTVIAGIGVIPIILWWVGGILISLAITSYTIIQINKLKAEVDKRKNLLYAQQQNLEAIAAAGYAADKGLISKETRDAIVKAAGRNLDANNESLATYANADATAQTQGGFFDKIQNIVLIVGGIIVLPKIMKL